MVRINRRNIWLFIFTAVLVLIAFSCRRIVVFVENEPIDKLLNFIRTFIYIGIYCAWGISVQRRVVQVQARKFLIAVSCFMASWFILREIKYRFVLDDNIIRYFWYFYYIPLLAIPLLAFLVSLSLGRSEDYHIPHWTYICFGITFVLVLFVLTNDFHQLVFSFPKDAAVWTEFNRSIGIMYYAIILWGVFCTLGALTIMLKKCRIPQSKRIIWLPLVPFTVSVLYFVLYTLNVPFVRNYFSDFAVFCCLMFLCFFESCIRCGLIQSNSRYSDLFSASVDTAVQIVDNEYNVRYRAGSAETLPKDIMKSAEKKPIIIENEKRLQNMPINGGHAIWTEDISELINLRETLEDRQDELKERNALLRYEYEKEKEHRIIEEQNRLYDLLQSKTQAQFDSINLLVREYGEADNNQKKIILARIAVLGSYIKRSKDFILSADATPIMPQSKLESALAESFRALKFLNIQGSFLVDTEREFLSGKTIILAYDFFEDVIESVLDNVCYINVRVCNIGGGLRINIFTDHKSNTEKLSEKYSEARIIIDDDGDSFILPLEGGAV